MSGRSSPGSVQPGADHAGVCRPAIRLVGGPHGELRRAQHASSAVRLGAGAFLCAGRADRFTGGLEFFPPPRPLRARTVADEIAASRLFGGGHAGVFAGRFHFVCRLAAVNIARPGSAVSDNLAGAGRIVAVGGGRRFLSPAGRCQACSWFACPPAPPRTSRSLARSVVREMPSIRLA